MGIAGDRCHTGYAEVIQVGKVETRLFSEAVYEGAETAVRVATNTPLLGEGRNLLDWVVVAVGKLRGGGYQTHGI